MKLYKFILVSLLVWSTSLQASVIGNVTNDIGPAGTFTDIANDRVWLDVKAMDQMNYDQASNALNTTYKGFSFATFTDVADLLLSALSTQCPPESCSYAPSSDNQVFKEIIGISPSRYYGTTSIFWFSELFGQNDFSDDEYTSYTRINSSASSYLVHSGSGMGYSQASNAGYTIVNNDHSGWWAYKDIEKVPAPTALALIGLGLPLLGFSRRKQPGGHALCAHAEYDNGTKLNVGKLNVGK